MANNRQEQMQIPQAQPVPWQDKTFFFNGQWLPSEDAALIGPSNFSVLENLRYTDLAIEGVAGYTKINSTAIWGTTYNIDHGFQFTSNKKNVNTTGSYNFVHAYDPTSNDQGYLTMHLGAIGTTGSNFDTGLSFTTDNTYLHTDNSAGLMPRFSQAPQNTMCYCNGEETLFFSGYEHRIAAAFLSMDEEGGTSIDVSDYINTATNTQTMKFGGNLITNGDMEVDANWVDLSAVATNEQSTAQAFGGLYSRKFVPTSANDGIEQRNRSVVAGTEYRYSHWIYSASNTIAGVAIEDGDGTTNLLNNTDVSVIEDEWTRVTGTVTAAITGASAKYRIHGGSSVAGNFFADNAVFIEEGYWPEVLMLTTRPVQGFYFEMETVNTGSGVLSVEVWDGEAWAAVSNLDKTGITTNGKEMAKSGRVFFDHTKGTAELKYINELWLYAYRIYWGLAVGAPGGTNDKCEIKSISCDPGLQPRGNVWDGVYRQPIQCQIWENADDAFYDFTLHVNQSSDTTTPVGAEIGQIGASDYMILMFEEPLSAIRFTMLGDLINTSSVTLSQYYWNGHEWDKLTKNVESWYDKTKTGAKTLNKTGVTQWTPPTDEQKTQLFNSVGYAYKFEFSAGISGANPEDCVIDLIVGIPALNKVLDPFDFSALYKDRLMLGSFSTGDEGNRMDYSLSSAPDVWNGFATSDSGLQSLQFGGPEKLTGATQLYNRFGASVFSMLLVFKARDLFMLVGNTPSDFEIYTVSTTIGCPAPLTIASAELGLEVGQGLTRNIAMWISHSGPIMFDGAILKPITGIEAYFDPTDGRYVEWTAMADKARGWVDLVRKEYNVLLPSGAGATDVNVWLVYDLMRKKWFKKDTGTADDVRCGWNVEYSNNKQSMYGAIDGGFMLELERGTTWSGIGINQKLRTGDFWPSENIWDVACVRKFKLYTKRMAESGVSLAFSYYTDTTADSGAKVTWTDQAAGVTWLDQTAGVTWAAAVTATASLSLTGTQRVIEYIKDLNRVGWSHALQLEVETSSTEKGFEPIAWGLRYYITRKGDQAT